jgi:predicted PurR-regulated permease PerM
VQSNRWWSNAIFGVLFALALFLFARIMAPFVVPLLLSGFVVVLFQPVHARLVRLLPRRPARSAALSTLLVFTLLFLPLSAVGYVAGRELVEVAATGHVPESVMRHLKTELSLVDIQSALWGALSSGASLLGTLLGAGATFVIHTVLMIICTYYFFLDGRRLLCELTELVPINARYTESFFKEFRDVAYAMVYGNTATAVIQGALGGVGLWLAGVQRPLVWALAMTVLALIPIGGTALVWAPAALFLWLTGRAADAVFLLAWGALVVSTADNLLRPRLCSTRLTLHPLLVFLSIFGGLAVVGAMGLLIGPLIASLLMAMIRIYRRDFLGALSDEPPPRLRQVAGGA